MNDCSVQKEAATEKILEAILEYAGACHVENIINEIDEESGAKDRMPFPTELSTKINMLAADYRPKSRIERAWQGASKVLAKVSRLFM